MSQGSRKHNFIGVSGYGWSGSGALVDLLKELEGVYEPRVEFSLIWEPYGVLDLESSLVHNWDFLRHDTAIRDFLKYAKLLSRNRKKLGLWGEGYSAKLGIDFLGKAESYIESLVDMELSANTRLLEYRKTRLESLVGTLKRKMLPESWSAGYEKLYFSKKTHEDFIALTKAFIEDIFYSCIEARDKKYILLDQAIPIHNIDKSLRYFNNIKCFIVDRDPRDIYVDLIANNALVGLECKTDSLESARKFISWFKFLRENESEVARNKNTMALRFEDVVVNSLEARKKVCNFLGDSTSNFHLDTFFFSEVSRKNIGLWKTSPNIRSINLIRNSLREYCYEE